MCYVSWEGLNYCYVYHVNLCTYIVRAESVVTVCSCVNIMQRKEVILPCFKPLQRGIAACMNCPNTRVIRMVHSLLSRLMSLFPTESATSNVASKFEELEILYACVSKIVFDGLNNYEKLVENSHLHATKMHCLE